MEFVLFMQPLGKQSSMMEITQIFGSNAHTMLTYTGEETLQFRIPMGCQDRWKIQNKRIYILTQNVKLCTSLWEGGLWHDKVYTESKKSAQICGIKIHQGCLIQRLQICFRKFLSHKLLEVGNVFWRNNTRRLS